MCRKKNLKRENFTQISTHKFRYKNLDPKSLTQKFRHKKFNTKISTNKFRHKNFAKFRRQKIRHKNFNYKNVDTKISTKISKQKFRHKLFDTKIREIICIQNWTENFDKNRYSDPKFPQNFNIGKSILVAFSTQKNQASISTKTFSCNFDTKKIYSKLRTEQFSTQIIFRIEISTEKYFQDDFSTKNCC